MNEQQIYRNPHSCGESSVPSPFPILLIAQDNVKQLSASPNLISRSLGWVFLNRAPSRLSSFALLPAITSKVSSLPCQAAIPAG